VKKHCQSVDKISTLRDNISYAILSRSRPRHTSNRATRAPLHLVQGAHAKAARGRQPIHSLHLPQMYFSAHDPTGSKTSDTSPLTRFFTNSPTSLLRTLQATPDIVTGKPTGAAVCPLSDNNERKAQHQWLTDALASNEGRGKGQVF
jgi:hypothetical protein